MKRLSRRQALSLAFGAGLVATGRSHAQMFRRVGVAFGTTVSVTLEAPNPQVAETAFAAAFREIRRIDRIASLTDADGDLFRLNCDGHLSDPDPALVEMMVMASVMHEATEGAFDVSVQPLWLALDRAARSGGWLNNSQIAGIRSLVDQRNVRVSEGEIVFERPGMQMTLNSLARGLAADRVAAALSRLGVDRAMFDTDVLGARGERPGGGAWRAALRDPRDAEGSLGEIALDGCVATSGDYQYFWSPDFRRNHIIDPRRGESPEAFSSVCVSARSGLLADALSTAAFLSPPDRAEVLIKQFGAEAAFVDKQGRRRATSGFPIFWAV